MFKGLIAAALMALCVPVLAEDAKPGVSIEVTYCGVPVAIEYADAQGIYGWTQRQPDFNEAIARHLRWKAAGQPTAELEVGPVGCKGA
jgi:hypothetical protein